MCRAAIKFCGGCNPRYDRGARYQAFRKRLSAVAAFESPQEGVHYDFLLVIAGCHACQDLHLGIAADHLFYCTDDGDFEPIIREIEQIYSCIIREDIDK